MAYKAQECHLGGTEVIHESRVKRMPRVTSSAGVPPAVGNGESYWRLSAPQRPPLPPLVPLGELRPWKDCLPPSACGSPPDHDAAIRPSVRAIPRSAASA